MTNARGRGTYSEDTVRLLEMIGQRPIAYHPAFARSFGVKAAILLGQLLYWHGKQQNTDGWIRKTAPEIEEETALSEREQETARAGLMSEGCIEFKRIGMPAMPHYRVVHGQILECVLSKQVRTKRPNKSQQNVPTCEDVHRGVMLGQNVLSITESTHKTTTEITAEKERASRAAAPPANLDSAVSDEMRKQKPPRKRVTRRSRYDPDPSSRTPQVKLYRWRYPTVKLSRADARLIADTFTDLDAWQSVLDVWRWRPRNWTDMQERYEDTIAIRDNPPPKAQASAQAREQTEPAGWAVLREMREAA